MATYTFIGQEWLLDGKVYKFGDTLPFSKAVAELMARNGHPILVEDGEQLMQPTGVSDLAMAGVLSDADANPQADTGKTKKT